MKPVKMTMSHPLLAFSLALLTTACVFDEKEAKRGSVVDNELRVGTLYLADGKPAVNARVRVFSVSHVPDSAAGEYGTRTDSQGRYTLEPLEKGEYNITGELNGEYSYQDSVFITSNTKSIPSDTLEAPGTLIGIVAVQPDHDPRSATVQVLGTNSFSNVDAKGRFRLGNLGAGRYTLRALTTLPEYTPHYFSLTIRENSADTLKDTIHIPFTGIPAVRGLAAVYDTAAGRVTVSWNPVEYAALKDYLIYRSDETELIPSDSPLGKSKGPVYIDTVFNNPVEKARYGIRDTSDYRFEYRVRARSQAEHIGAIFGSLTVEAASPMRVRTLISFPGWKDSIVLGDTLMLEARFANPTRGSDALDWSVNGEEVRATEVSGKTGSDKLPFIGGRLGSYKVTVRVRDVSGAIWTDSGRIVVYAIGPRTQALPDILGMRGDTLQLRPVFEAGTGKIVKQEWLLSGRSDFIQVANGDTDVIVPDAYENKYRFRVTDEFGASSETGFTLSAPGTGTVWKPIQNDLPYIAGRNVKRTFLRIQDRFWMLLSSWDVGGVKPVQVWNSDNLRDWTRVTDSAAFPARIVRSAITYRGKLWIFGGEKSMGGKTGFNDAWSSTDGVTWTKVAEVSPIDTGNNGDFAFSFSGEMWIVAYDGALWNSVDGSTWARRGTVPARGEGIYSAVESKMRAVLVGRNGFYTSANGIDWEKEAVSVLGLSIVAPTGDQYTFNNGYLVDIRDVSHLASNLAGINHYARKRTSNLGGLYPHCFFEFGGAYWVLQGGRFTNEPRDIDIWYSR